MQDLSLHVLDIAENSVRADATLVEILLVEDERNDTLELEVKDDGTGMDAEMAPRATDPFFTTKQGRRCGLGLPLLAQACREAEGGFQISSTPGTGTHIRATFRYSHPDRKPVGDMMMTLATLVTGNRGVDFVYEHRKDSQVTRFDSRQLGPAP